MSEALRLAESYADAVSAHRLESLYGTSKSYTLEKAKERDEAHTELIAELRRLALFEAELQQAREELAALKSALGASCDDERQQLWEASSGGGCSRALDAERELAALRASLGEPCAFIRRWAFDGEKPEKEKNANGRLAWPKKYLFVDVSKHQCAKDDVPLFAIKDAK